MNKFSPRRTGGRSTRNSALTAPLPKHLRLLSDSMSGCTFSQLDDAEMARIHTEVLDTLKTSGLSQPLDSGVVYMNHDRSNAGQ